MRDKSILTSMFKRLEIEGIRQFGRVSIDLDKRLTIITGANGAGKTTLLNILNTHFEWETELVSTPQRDVGGVMNYVTGYLTSMKNRLFGSSIENTRQKIVERVVGRIIYEDEKQADVKVPKDVRETFRFSLSDKQEVLGLHIPSHRPSFIYQKVEQMPTRAHTAEEIFERYSSDVKQRSIKGVSDNAWHEKTTPNYLIKEDLLSLIVFGSDSDRIRGNQSAKELLSGFEGILKIVLPPNLQFQKIGIESPEVLLESSNQKSFSLDSASGGVVAIIDLAWQIYIFSKQEKLKGHRFVVTIDEPENHLHPEMQRTLLRNFIKAFPQASFIVTTHNPFIVTSVEDSNVYVLDYDENGDVYSYHLNQVNKAWDSNKILRRVLGLTTTMPLWAEDRLSEIVAKYSDGDITKDKLSALRGELEEIGFDDVIPEALTRVTDKHDTLK